MDKDIPLVSCTHCTWKHTPEAKTCPRCGLMVKHVPAPITTKTKIKSIGVVLLLAGLGGPLVLELPLGFFFGAGLGASGLFLTLLGGDSH